MTFSPPPGRDPGRRAAGSPVPGVAPVHDPRTAASVRAVTDDDSGLAFCLSLSRAQATVTRRLDAALSSLHGLSFADFMILHALGRAPGEKLRRVDLAERVGLTASGVTRSLIPLEKLGLVSRQPDPRDARVGYATLSDAGRQLLEHAAVAVRTVAGEATSTVPDDRFDELSALLRQLAGMNSSNS